MSEKKFCWWVEINQSTCYKDNWYSELIWSSQVPVVKRQGEPGWSNFLLEEPNSEAVVMVAPRGRTLTFKEFNGLKSHELHVLYHHQGFRYIKRYRLFEVED